MQMTRKLSRKVAWAKLAVALTQLEEAHEYHYIYVVPNKDTFTVRVIETLWHIGSFLRCFVFGFIPYCFC